MSIYRQGADLADWDTADQPRRRRGRRLFERGDLKYVVLDLLAEQPRHGYDIIRVLEDRFEGLYSPSPGSVYPTLEMLADMGFVDAHERDGKRIFSITAEGSSFLAEHGSVLEDVRHRIGAWPSASGREELGEVGQELRRLRQLLGKGRAHMNVEGLRRVREILARARSEVDAILKEEGERSR